MTRADWSDGHGLRLSAEDFIAAAVAVSAYGEHLTADSRHIADDVLRVAGPKIVAAYLRRMAQRSDIKLVADVRGWLREEADTLDSNGDPR